MEYPRRAVQRSDFNSRGMSCNYFQQDEPGGLWKLHLADSTLVDEPAWTITMELVDEFLREGLWIELLPEEIISV